MHLPEAGERLFHSIKQLYILFCMSKHDVKFNKHIEKGKSGTYSADMVEPYSTVNDFRT